MSTEPEKLPVENVQESSTQPQLTPATIQQLMSSTLESLVRNQLQSIYQQLQQMEKSLSSKQK